MSMITELDLVANVVKGGEKIKVIKYTLNNAHIHQVCEVASRLQIGLLECDSNNTSGLLTAEDAQTVLKAWAQVKFEWETAKKFQGLGAAAIEKTYTFLAITSNEIMRTVNVKCRRIVQALETFLVKMAYCQSARAQYGLSKDDVAKTEKHIAYIEYLIAAYVGTGVEKDDGSADTGMEVADYPYVGTLVPPLNLHEVQTAEPSPAAPDVPAPDAPDTPSTVPSPGTDTSPAAAK